MPYGVVEVFVLHSCVNKAQEFTLQGKGFVGITDTGGAVAVFDGVPAGAFLSGFAADHILADVSALGAKYYMLKPCDMPTLMSRIRGLAAGFGNRLRLR